MWVYTGLVLCIWLLPAQAAEQPPVISKFANINSDNHIQLLNENQLNRFSFECLAKGQPQPQYKWFKDGEELSESNLPAGLELGGSDSQILDFSEPSVQEHSGHYHCEASNTVGKALSEVIFVTDTLPKYPEWAVFPTFDEQPETEIKEAGRNAEFRCSASGDPAPDITWTKNGEILTDAQGSTVRISPFLVHVMSGAGTEKS